MRKPFVTLLAIAALSLVNATVAQAAPISIINDDAGWYDDTGDHGGFFGTENTNYIAGRATDESDVLIHYTDFFVFDLSGVSGTVTSATLQLYSATISSDGTYKSFHVVTPVATLVAGTGGVLTHLDLQNGPLFGQIALTTAQSDTLISITLNAAAIAAIQANLGGMFAIGGDYLGNGTDSDYTFGFSGDYDFVNDKGILDDRNQLILDGVTRGVPDGGLTISLLGGALVALGALRRKFNQ